MAAVDLELFKKHVRADDFEEDDDYLVHLLKASEEVVVTYTRRTVGELTEMGGGDMPDSIRQAIMMLAAHWYNQRESVSTAQMHQVPDSLAVILKPYRRLV